MTTMEAVAAGFFEEVVWIAGICTIVCFVVGLAIIGIAGLAKAMGYRRRPHRNFGLPQLTEEQLKRHGERYGTD